MSETIDLFQDLVSTFNREDLLALVDFRSEESPKGPVQGLCKIARPKEKSSCVNYASLTLLIDTPDEASSAAAA